MNFELKPLPYDYDALAPFLGVETLKTHHQKHHAGYLDKLDRRLDGGLRDRELADIVRRADDPALFNLAAQVWNHDFYWQSLAVSRREPRPDGRLMPLVKDTFGGLAELEARFADLAKGIFGSGWAWLTFDPDSGRLTVEGTENAGNPLTEARVPLLTLDVWEHAYYLDYQQDRGAYVNEFIDGHLNWSFAEANLQTAVDAAAA